MNQTEPDDPDAVDPETGRAKPDEPTVAIPGRDQELAKLREERDLLEQQLQRQLADAANMRRRHRQELDDNRRRVLEGFAQELLPVLDNFDSALAAAAGKRAADPGLLEGVRMTRLLLASALERHGVQEIPAVGATFDPALHDAVAVESAPGVPAGQILRVLQPGYQLGDRVIRHARVVVAGPGKT